MKRCLGILIVSLFFAVPMMLAQENNYMDHFEVGAFANYYRLADPSPTRNFFGIGGRAGFGLTRNVQIEGEMAYDFERNYTSTYSNTITSTTVTSRLRSLHGFFGPKFQTGSGPFRFFVTGKVGFDNFNVTNQGAPTGFSNSVGLANGATYFALYPGAGIEVFSHWIGLRAEAGDDVFFSTTGHTTTYA